MITVTSVRTNIAIEVIEGAIFDPGEAAILKLAYDRAVEALAAEYDLTSQAKIKLAKAVLRIGRMRLAAGHSLTDDADVRTIASAAGVHLLSVSADHSRLLSPTPLFRAGPPLPAGFQTRTEPDL